jgi:hypothetical protein
MYLTLMRCQQVTDASLTLDCLSRFSIQFAQRCPPLSTVPLGTLFAAEEEGAGKTTWLCSCMMFLHVARMREAGWIGGNPWLASQITNKSNWGISTLGDQAMFNWVRKTSPHLHGKPIDSKWVASNCESSGFRGSRGSQPKSPPGMLPESGRQPWTARHFNCFGPKDYASGNGKIFVYYTTLAKQKDVNVCDHRFTSVDTSQPAVNSATLV